VKLLRFRAARGLATGVLTPRGVCDLGVAFDDFAWALGAEGSAQAARMLASAPAQPLAAGARLFCIGLNYRDHVAETGREMPPQP
jgi:2-keto-4-pentenoate hydratase/2-oxohepta-3-ene-1,7-dioic acid hydratase in catechol pathway